MGDDWQSQKFRQNVIAKINEMLQNTGSDPTKNASVMENHIFKKSRSKEEYLGLVAKLFMHFKELATRKPQQAPPPNAEMGNANIMQDPLNALQNLASQGNRNAQMMPMTGPNPNQMAPGAVVGVNAAASNLLQTLNQQRPGQQMQNMQGIRGQMNVPMGTNVGPGQGNVVGPGSMVPQMAGNMGNMNMNVMGNQSNQMVGAGNQMGMGPGQMNQMGGGVGVGGVAAGNQMQINANMQGGPMNVNAMNVPQMPMNSMNQNQMNLGMNHPQLNQMITRMNNNGPMNVGPNVVQQGMHNQLNAGQNMPPNQGGPIHPNNVGAGPQVGIPPNAGQPGNLNQIINMPNMQQKSNMPINQGGNMFLGNRGVSQQSFLRQSPSPTVSSPAGMGQSINQQQQQQQMQQQQLQQQQQQSQQQQQQQQQQQPQPPQLPNPQMIPSPALVASSSPQMSTLMSNNQRALRQSPNAPLNTPGQVSVSSPFNPKEDQLYREKYQQLTKYIEPLKRMVSKISNDGANVEKITKMSKLLEILVNPTQRVPLETLLKCEKALEKMEIVSYSGPPFGKSSNPLMEVISTTLQSPIANHTLQRTFKPSLEMLFGTDIGAPTAAKHPRLASDETSPFVNEIPHVLQGEIARLDQKFKVSLDTSAQNNTNTIKLICCLDDKRLPCVPPVSVNIPDEYPSASPNCSLTEQEYSATPFLLAVQNALTARIAKLPKCHSLSHLLDTWEMSVRQACSPNAIAPCDFTALFGV